jgi:EmrB/QacA subfamily drug resistance transporter
MKTEPTLSPATTGSAALTGIRPNVVLATCCLSLLLVSMDVTIVNVALPSIARDLHATISGLQWSIDGYTVVIASFLILGGTTADRLGRRRIFQTGLILFSLGSLLCSLSSSTTMLVIFRMLQALGGSMLNPVAMSIIANTFVEPKARARAIGVWGAVVGISMAIGPVLGGILTQTVGWRAIFWVNVPIGLTAIWLTTRFVPESRAAQPRRLDPVGQVFIIVILGALTTGLIEGPQLGWISTPIVGAFVLVAASLVFFIFHEKRRTEPLIDLRFFKSIPLSTATLVAVLGFSAFGGFLFLNSLYLQEVRRFPASTAGMCLLPTALMMFVCSPLSGRLVGSGRTRTAMVLAGFAMALAGFLLTDLSAAVPLVRLLAAYAIFGMGFGLVNAPITNTAVSGLPLSQAGLATALASTSRQVGATLGVALAGSIVVSGVVSDLAASTHAFWWLIVANGLAISLLGFYSTTQRARDSVARISNILHPAEEQTTHPSLQRSN